MLASLQERAKLAPASAQMAEHGVKSDAFAAAVWNGDILDRWPDPTLLAEAYEARTMKTLSRAVGSGVMFSENTAMFHAVHRRAWGEGTLRHAMTQRRLRAGEAGAALPVADRKTFPTPP